MLTKLTVRNFKRFRTAEIELGNPVVLIGSNNSGKTSALQALALWEIGLRRWNEKRTGGGAPEKRPGVAINRRDLTAIPVPDANLLRKSNYHELARFVPKELIDPEIGRVLDAIDSVAGRAKPAGHMP